MTTLKYERIIAKRNHRQPCEMSGLAIERGDRYFVGAWAEDGSVTSIKAHSILQDMAHESMKRGQCFDEGWDPTYGAEYLYEWLQRQLDRTEEARECCQAALDYWFEHSAWKKPHRQHVPW